MTAPSYPPSGYPASSGPRPRPGVVTVASYLLYAVALIEVFRGIVTLTTYSATSEALTAVYEGTQMAGSAKTIALLSTVGGAVLGIVLAAGFVVLGLLNGKGKNVSRIVTWVIGGLSLCCTGVSLGGTALLSSLEPGSNQAGGPSSAEVQARIDAAIPGWVTPVSTVTTVLILVLILATIILLALPASNEFFRKPAAPGYPYPGQAYPQAPYPGQAYPAPHGSQGQPGDPAPGLPPYPGQSTPPPPHSDDEPPRPV